MKLDAETAIALAAPPRRHAAFADITAVQASDTFHPTMNGVVRSVDNAARSLREGGASVRVLAPGSRRDREAAPEDARLLHSIPTPFYPGLRLAFAPARRADVDGANVIHVHTPGPVGVTAALRARRAGIRVVYTHHTRYDQAIEHFAPRLLRRPALHVYERACRRLMPKVDAVIAPTPTMAEELRRRYGVDARTVPTGIADGFLEHAAEAITQRRSGDEMRILTVGRLAPEKNIARTLQAFALLALRVRRARLVVAGAGPHESSLRALAKELGIARRIEWTGYVPDDELAALYASCDVFVLTSKYETQGLTITEAAACGARIVCPALPVFDGIVAAEAALPCDPDEPREIAAAMLEAAERAELSAAARSYAELFRSSRIARELADVYRA